MSSKMSRALRKQDKKIKQNAKDIAAARQATLFSSLLGGGELESFNATPNGNPADATQTTYTVSDSSFDKTSAILPLVLSGGLGGGSGSGMNNVLPLLLSGDNDDNMLPLILALSGGLGK
ncbi:MAG: hypothetical protein AAF806_12525 [Bacteroidota bacterium]